jgi:hypothetical protein
LATKKHKRHKKRKGEERERKNALNNELHEYTRMGEGKFWSSKVLECGSGDGR